MTNLIFFSYSFTIKDRLQRHMSRKQAVFSCNFGHHHHIASYMILYTDALFETVKNRGVV
jgi:hypothetical protein